MDNFEQAKYINKFLKSLYDASFSLTLAEGIEGNKLPSEENIENFKTLEFIIEKLDLVKFIQGRNNSTLNGQCEYEITLKGRELVEKNESSLTFLVAEDFKKLHPEFYDEKIWDNHFDTKIDKRVIEADFFLDLLVSENLLNIDKASLKNHFKKWFKENKDFDLQIKNGDLAIEDGELQMVPDFNKNDILSFMKWFNSEKDSFLDFLKNEGVKFKNSNQKQTINNNGNLYINNKSKVKNQNPKFQKHQLL